MASVFRVKEAIGLLSRILRAHQEVAVCEQSIVESCIAHDPYNNIGRAFSPVAAYDGYARRVAV